MRVLRCAAESIDGVGAGYWRAQAWSSSVGAGGSDPMRFPSLEPERMSPAQKRVHDAIASGPRGGVRGPFGVLLRSPELADRVQKVGEHLRFNSSLPARLNEMAILINARFWESKYEWTAHKPLALKGGLAEPIVDELAQTRRPRGMKPDEEIVYDVCMALHKTHFVDDALF